MTNTEWQSAFLKKRIVIWGASIGGNQTYEILTKNEIFPEAYCDNSEAKWGGVFNRLPIISPKQLYQYAADKEEYLVIIASVFYDDIYKQMMELGITVETWILLLYDPLGVKKKQHYSIEEQHLLKTLYVTEDEYTTRLIALIEEKDFLNGHSFGKIENYIGHGGIEKYFYDEMSSKVQEEKITLIDAGAYIGDSILQMKSVFGDRIHDIYAFEPIRTNYEIMENKNISNLHMYPLALGREKGETTFKVNAALSSESLEGDYKVYVDFLDNIEIIPRGKCLLKIDVEGSERELLEGAKKFIERYRPYIAICVYHRSEDIYELPQWLLKTGIEYSFYLRGGMHTVCYAIPK